MHIAKYSMLTIYRRQFYLTNVGRLLSSASRNAKSWKKTLLLPRPVFNIHQFVGKNSEKKYSAYNKKWNDYFTSQASSSREKFWLHDGPPYANGRLHAGHLLNKLLKDIICRHQIMKGKAVFFRPGWDCHGLPIELAVQKKNRLTLAHRENALKLREACHKAAIGAVSQQKRDFMEWGVVGDWKTPYLTLNFEYELAELELFTKLVERGLVFRSLQPVYWSPTSRTAIAESELEYNPSHRSLSAFVAFKTCPTESDAEDYLATWTTTLWSLPANEAVAFSPKLDYSWYCDPANPHRRYLIANCCSGRLSQAAEGEMQHVADISQTELANLRYCHPFNSEKLCSVIPSDHVTSDLGTGLVHVAPVHGHDDWALGLKHKLNSTSAIDDDGRFSEKVGCIDLIGRRALGEKDGIAAVLRHFDDNLSGAHKIAVEPIIHSYPYDWRTRAPKQLEAVSIQPDNLRKKFEAMLTSRDHWCISRQRVWGVPIPVFFEDEAEEMPVLDPAMLRSVIASFKSSGTTSCWWNRPPEELVSNSAALKAQVDRSNLVKGHDILDVWFDSGASWFAMQHCKTEFPRVADCYVEGVDQFRGWFLSSLLLAVAANEPAPYKRLLWHGFVVDNSGKKMSKSVGNVLDPRECILGSPKTGLRAVGLDGVRLWSARSQNESLVKLGSSTLAECRQLLLRVRNIFSFLLRNLMEPFTPVSFSEMNVVDKYMVFRTAEIASKMMESYDNFNFRRAINLADKFLTIELSQHYFTVSKDRLYCDSKDWHRRRSCLTALELIAKNFTHVLAPVIPFTSEEVASHLYPASPEILLAKKYLFTGKATEYCAQINLDSQNDLDNHLLQIQAVVQCLLSVRESWLQTAAPADATDYQLQISFFDRDNQFLDDLAVVAKGAFQDAESVAAEVLHVSSCEFKQSPTPDNQLLTEISYSVGRSTEQNIKCAINWNKIDPATKCTRCRRFTKVYFEHSLCTRCEKVVKA